MSIQVWEMLDSMSGSVTLDLENGERRILKRRYVFGQMEGFNHTVTEATKYAPVYISRDASGVWWIRKQLDITGIGNRHFEVTATYETFSTRNELPEGGGEQVKFEPGSMAWDTTGHTEHITQAYKQTKYGAEAPDFERAINVSGDSVNGLDVVRPGMRYSETWIVPAAKAMDADYVGKVHRLTGTVNKHKFRAFDPGEALFMGARGQWQGDMPWVAITFDFEGRPNEEVDFSNMGGGLQGVTFTKKGWEHLWLLYETGVDQNSIIQKPRCCFVNEVYKEEEWGDLGIVGYTPDPPAIETPTPPLQAWGWNNNP